MKKFLLLSTALIFLSVSPAYSSDAPLNQSSIKSLIWNNFKSAMTPRDAVDSGLISVGVLSIPTAMTMRSFGLSNKWLVPAAILTTYTAGHLAYRLLFSKSTSLPQNDEVLPSPKTKPLKKVRFLDQEPQQICENPGGQIILKPSLSKVVRELLTEESKTDVPLRLASTTGVEVRN
jgi:hypothetical protein